MKKINKKGFTLVELLAVIIILAIVVGITIPAVLTTTRKTKEKAFKTVAENAAEWIDKQYEVYMADVGSLGVVQAESSFVDACFGDDYGCFAEKTERGQTMADLVERAGSEQVPGDELFEAIGLNSNNVNDFFFVINEDTGRSCVMAFANPDGDYYTTYEKRYVLGGDCS